MGEIKKRDAKFKARTRVCVCVCVCVSVIFSLVARHILISKGKQLQSLCQTELFNIY